MYRPLVYVVLFWLTTVVTASARDLESTALQCDLNPAYCSPTFTLFCSNGQQAQFQFGLNEYFDFEFQAQFPGNSPRQRYQLFFSNGHFSGAGLNEIAITKLQCGSNNQNGQSCKGRLGLRKAEKLTNSGEFDFDQAILNVSLRYGRRDVCIGKFTNNAEKITSNARLTRQYCTFQPNSDHNSTLFGRGFFDPNGYGMYGEALLHLTLEGFPVREKIKGCLKLDELKYRRVFSFYSHASHKSDERIYRTPTDEEATTLAEQGLYYSYDFFRQLHEQQTSALLLLPGRSLSQINRQVSSPAARTERSQSVRKRRRYERRQAKRLKRRQARRKAHVAEIGSLSTSPSTRVPREPVLSWLAFDPLVGGEILISPSCLGDVENKSYGRLTCGTSDDSNSTRRCISLSSPSNTEQEGRSCRETNTVYNLLLIRAQGLPIGNYHICLNGITSGLLLPISSVGTNTYGSIELSDSELLANHSPAITYTSTNLSAVNQVTLATDGSCGTPVVSGSFEDDE